MQPWERFQKTKWWTSKTGKDGKNIPSWSTSETKIPNITWPAFENSLKSDTATKNLKNNAECLQHTSKTIKNHANAFVQQFKTDTFHEQNIQQMSNIIWNQTKRAKRSLLNMVYSFQKPSHWHLQCAQHQRRSVRRISSSRVRRASGSWENL